MDNHLESWQALKERPEFHTGAVYQKEKLDHSEVHRHTEARLGMMLVVRQFDC